MFAAKTEKIIALRLLVDLGANLDAKDTVRVWWCDAHRRVVRCAVDVFP